MVSVRAQRVSERPLPRAFGRIAAVVAPRFTERLLGSHAPDATPVEVAAAAENVRGSIAAMPDVLRTGVGLASGMVRAGLPAMAEFGRLTRGLGLAAVYEQRTRELIRTAGEPSP